MVMNISCKFEKASYNIFFDGGGGSGVTTKRHSIHRIASGGYYVFSSLHPVDTMSFRRYAAAASAVEKTKYN